MFTIRMNPLRVEHGMLTETGRLFEFDCELVLETGCVCETDLLLETSNELELGKTCNVLELVNEDCGFS